MRWGQIVIDPCTALIRYYFMVEHMNDKSHIFSVFGFDDSVSLNAASQPCINYINIQNLDYAIVFVCFKSFQNCEFDVFESKSRIGARNEQKKIVFLYMDDEGASHSIILFAKINWIVHQARDLQWQCVSIHNIINCIANDKCILTISIANWISLVVHMQTVQSYG